MIKENLASDDKEIALKRISMITNELLMHETLNKFQNYQSKIPFTTELTISYLSEVFDHNLFFF